MRKIYNTMKFLTVLCLIAVASLPIQAQVLDQWVRVNEGFAKCAKIGESAGEAEWYRDNFTIKETSYRRGEMYIWVEYTNTNPTLTDGVTPHPEYNAVSCSGGFFRHDTIRNEWVMVANVPPRSQYDAGKMVTNRSEIFFMAGGRVYQFTTDYTNHPTGWKKISKIPNDPLSGDQVWSSCDCIKDGCAPGANVALGGTFADAINDTIYVLLVSKNTCPTYQNKIGKFSITSGTWTFDNIGALPHQAYGNPGLSDQFWKFTFTERIGNLFNYFWSTREWGEEFFIPNAYFVYDPRTQVWNNISRGVKYHNFTGSSCGTPACKACENAATYDPATCGPINLGLNVDANWGDAGPFTPSWDRREIFVNSGMGIFKWDATDWIWMADKTQGRYELITENGGFTKGYYGRGPVISTKFDGLYRRIGGFGEIFYCHHVDNSDLLTANNGRTLYIVHKGMKDKNTCDWPGRYIADIGIFKIFPDPLKPSPVTNLHLQSGTYLGGTGGDNSPVNVAIGGNNNIHVAGNFAGVQALTTPGALTGPITNTLLGAASTDRAKIITLNNLGDTIRRAVSLGGEFYDMEIQNNGQKRMVVSGSFGVAVLDSNAQNVIWHRSLASIYTDLGIDPLTPPFGGAGLQPGPYFMVDIDDIGRVVIAGGYNFSHRYRVVNVDGLTWRAPSTTCFGGGIGQEFLYDVAISGDKVFFAGMNNGCLNEPAATSCSGVNVTTCVGREVQSSWVKCHAFNGSTYDYAFKTFGYRGRDLTLDQADTRAYRINVGADGKLYMLGEAAGGNSAFRWKGGPNDAIQLNGCSNPTGGLISYDNYNMPVQTASAHIAYFCTIDPVSGLVERGQYIIPRQNDGKSNSFRIKDGYIHADEAGFVYVGGLSAFKYAGRDVNTINGYLVGAYAGDQTVLINSPDYLSRTFWGGFSDTLGSGQTVGIGIRGNIIAALGRNEKGKSFTGASRFAPGPIIDEKCDKEFKREYAINQDPFNLDWNGSNANEDTYLAVWYQDVWNYATCDSLERRELPTDTLPNPWCKNCKADFEYSTKELCVGQIITYTNSSIGDSTAHKWNFGDGAMDPATNTSMGTDVLGKGPWSVKYSTPGIKKIRFDAVFTYNNPDYKELLDSINVLPNTTALGVVTGPDSVCAGGEVFYDVTPIAGVTYYNWTVPVGATILDGQGGPTIRVVLGSAGGNVSVQGTYACGLTPPSFRSVTVNGPLPSTVLIVTGSAGPTAGDMAIKPKLVAKGYNVLYMSDAAVSGSNAECMGLVIISNSADSSKLQYKLRQLRTPVMVMNPMLLGYMNMTNGSSADRGRQTAQTQVNLIDVIHETGQWGAAMGNSTVYTTNKTVGWGVPSASAAVVATVAGDASKPAIFAYEQGAAMRGYDAPDRRLFFFMDSTGLVAPLGTFMDTAFSRAVCWAMRNCPTNRIITTLPVNAQYCAGDSIKIRFTKTGIFNGVVPDKTAPANNITVDNCQAGQTNTDGSSKFTTIGSWNVRTTGSFIATGSGCVGATDYLFSNKTSGDRKAIYQPELPYKGRYRVKILVPNHGLDGTSGNDSASSAVEVRITHNGGTFVSYVNQRTGFTPTGKIIDLGIFEFEKGPGARVEINNANNLGVNVVADAVQFTPDSLYPEGNIFTAQLSNAFGNFNAATVLGQVQNTDSSTIQGILPVSIGSGTGYRIRVISSSPTVVGSDTGFSGSNVFSVIGPPQRPGPITGPTTVCQNAGGQTYSIAAVAGVDSLMWTRPTGASWDGGPTTLTYTKEGLSVNVNFGSSTGGTIRVQTKNACGVSSPINGASELAVNVSGLIPNQPNVISGPTTVCTAKKYTYTFNANDPKATHWDWSTSDPGITFWDGAVSSPTGPTDGSNTVTVSFSPDGGPPKLLRVFAKGPCGVSASPRTLSVNVNNAATVPVLGPISAVKGQCGGDSTYTVSPIIGALSYQWLYPATNNINDASTTNTTKVTYTGPVAGNIQVRVTDACGTSPYVSRAVNVTGDTSTLDFGFPFDTLRICGQIQLSAGTGYSSYLWNTGEVTPTIIVAADGVYSVFVTDVFGCGTYDSVVVVSSNPLAPTVSDTTLELGPCGTSNVLLSASGSTGIYRWYDAPFGGTLLDSTSSTRIENISVDTAIYVSSWQYGNPESSPHLLTTNNNEFLNLDAFDTGLDYLLDFTAESWVKYSGAVESRGIWTQQNQGFVIITTGTGLVRATVDVDNALPHNDITLTGTTDISDGNWHHVALVWEKGNMYLYVNGVLEASSLGNAVGVYKNTSNRWRIGGNDVAGNSWQGSIDEVRFWLSARTQQQIQQNMYSCVPVLSNDLWLYTRLDSSTVDLVSGITIPKGGAANYNGTNGVLIGCGVCESGRQPINITVIPAVASAFSVQDYVVCNSGDNAPLTAVGGSGKFRWYDAPSGGTLLDSINSSYTVNNVTANTSVYVSSWDNVGYSSSQYLDKQTGHNGIIAINSCIGGYKSNTKVTFEMWIKTLQPALSKPVMLVKDQNNDFNAVINDYGASGGAIGVRINTISPATVLTFNGVKKVNDNQWHHVAIVFNQGSAFLYVDGILDGSVSGGGQLYSAGSSQRFGIGGDDDSNRDDFLGGIDEVRIWTEARTQSQILATIDRCIPANSSGLLGYWKFDGNGNEETGNMTSCTANSAGASDSWKSNGVNLACTFCESARKKVDIFLGAGELITNNVNNTQFCQGSSITVPFSICAKASPCTAGKIEDLFNDELISPRWNVIDYDGTNFTNFAENASGRLNITATGTISSTNSTFAGLYRNDIAGDFDATLQIVSRSAGGNASRHGLMISNNFSNLSSGGLVFVGLRNQDNRSIFAVDLDGDGILETQTAVGTLTLPIWVRVVKSGTNFSGYYSASSETGPWTQIGSTTSVPTANTNVQVGIVAASDNGSIPKTMTFDNFKTNKFGDMDTSTYKYVVQLSNSTGSFASGTVYLADTLMRTGPQICGSLLGQVVTTLPLPMPTGGTYRSRIVQIAPNNSTVTDADGHLATFTIPTNTWTGATDNNWHVNGNWSCQIPDSTLDAIIPVTANHPQILAGNASAKVVTIAAGASLTMQAGTYLGLWGNITNSGTFLAGANSSLSLNRSDAPQTITGISSLANLVLNNPMGANMSVSSMSLSGNFTFQRGKFDLTGSKTLDLCSGSGAVTGGSATSYFTQTDANVANGFLKIGVQGDGNDVIFPVGIPVSYNPATISNTGTSTCMQVRVFGSVLENGLNGNTITEKFVNRTWEITPSVPTGVNADITLQWNAGDEQPTYDRTSSFVVKNRGIPGDNLYLQAGPQGAAGGIGPYTAQAKDVTTFSKFGSTSNPNYLPIDLLNFKGKNIEGNTLLEWTTGYEASCATYYIEKSTDGGESFQTIGEVACKNNPTGADYIYWDRLLTQNSWYRLRQVDVDGQTTMSNIILVRVSALEASAFSLSPNPSSDRVKLSYGTALTDWDEVDMKVTTMQGVEVVKISSGLSTLNKELNRQLKELAGGMYIISLEFGDVKQHIKWTVLK